MTLNPVVVGKLNLTNLTSIENVLNSNKQLSVVIDEAARRHHTTDVGEIMRKLESIGEILKLAYAGSKGMPCSRSVMGILCKYQTMISSTFAASVLFLDGCLSALSNHREALMFAERGKLEKTLVFLRKCSREASRMAEECGKLVVEASELCEMSSRALMDAQRDESLSNKERNEIRKMVDESRARQAEADAKILQLHRQIEEYRKQQAKVAAKADMERLRDFCLKVISTTLTPVNVAVGMAESASSAVDLVAKTVEKALKDRLPSDSSESKQENSTACSSLVEQENLIIKLKNELLKEEREANAKIAELGERIKGYKNKDEDLNAAIASLGIAIEALGKVRTIFEYTRRYWLGVKTRCERLADIDLLVELHKDADFKDEFIVQLKLSALNWLALGKNNYQACRAIQIVANRYDHVMSNLPTRQVAKKIVENSESILIELTQETFKE